MKRARKQQEGVALLLTLWAILILSILTANLVYNMRLEKEITDYQRKKAVAAKLARAGYEWSKFMITKSGSSFSDEEEYGEVFRDKLKHLQRGVPVRWDDSQNEMGAIFEKGTFTVEIIPEQGRRNVNTLDEAGWHQLFERSGVPDELWDELVDTLADWIDSNDLHQLNGAEEDDAFYRDAGYKPKNAPIDTIDELLLIKGWTPEILYGGPSDLEEGLVMTGLASHLTTLGDGKINVNSASTEVLWSIPGIDEFGVDGILAGRLGVDGEAGTEDDGFQSADDAIAAGALDPEEVNGQLTVSDKRFLRIVAIGEVDGITSGIWALVVVEGDDIVPLFWREAQMP